MLNEFTIVVLTFNEEDRKFIHNLRKTKELVIGRINYLLVDEKEIPGGTSVKFHLRRQTDINEGWF